MSVIIEVNVDAVYSGYSVSFEYVNKKYVMRTTSGNRGTMTIHLISINPDTKTYDWKYTHKDGVATSHYETIEQKIEISECMSIWSTT